MTICNLSNTCPFPFSSMILWMSEIAIRQCVCHQMANGFCFPWRTSCSFLLGGKGIWTRDLWNPFWALFPLYQCLLCLFHQLTDLHHKIWPNNLLFTLVCSHFHQLTPLHISWHSSFRVSIFLVSFWAFLFFVDLLFLNCHFGSSQLSTVTANSDQLS